MEDESAFYLFAVFIQFEMALGKIRLIFSGDFTPFALSRADN
jgi:hypothetical protein